MRFFILLQFLLILPALAFEPNCDDNSPEAIKAFNQVLGDTFGAVMFDNLFMIIAEDSGVEVIDFNQQQKWFQLLSPKPFTNVKLHKNPIPQ